MDWWHPKGSKQGNSSVGDVLSNLLANEQGIQ